ncbi:ABC transporter ATP-binding protein [Anaerocolumna aminovalerica]|uniref:ABC transporter ATP-binding protein n=1 Tax=Anaerocolumna aminovalerica TaxID=1527 RepID=UPI001C0EE5C4|nr:ABC transporter ATP-binding protein [Anaerocolumna aminovalerica]MBU5331516.1 ABC transporter ATP-binding protein [Anaerocolumna aminovalerica]
MITIQNLTKIYKIGDSTVIALDNVNLEIKKGEFLAITGPSGSGKSTLLHMMAGVDIPTSGNVFIEGKNINKLQPSEQAIFRRRHIGMIYQSFNLIPTLTVEENIILPLMLDGKKIDRAMLMSLLELLGLSERRKHLPNQLSGGQQQRVYLLDLSRSRLDAMLKGLEKFPPVEIVISIPFMIAIIIASGGIILVSTYPPAKKAAKIRPIEALRQNQQIHISKWEQKQTRNSALSNFATKIISRFFQIEGQLAYKTYKRFKRRYYPVLMAMSVNIALCMVLSSFSHYTNDVISMTYSGMDYNINIHLSCDDSKLLGQTANELVQISDNQLSLIRQTAFELRNPLPLSETGYGSGLFQGSGRQPDAVLLSVDENTLNSICNREGIDKNTLSGNTGIFINDERTWRNDGVQEKGRPYHLETGDILPVYSTHVSDLELSKPNDAIDIKIAAVIDYSPEYTKVDAPTSLVILVSEDTFLSLEPCRPFAERDGGTHNVILRGMVDEADVLENSTSTYLNKQTQVHGNIYNYDEQIRGDQAGIASIRYLLTGLIIILLFICMFSNFIVTWTIAHGRIKEFSILSSIGMTPESIRKMKKVESLLNSIKALVPGTAVGKKYI